MPFSFWCSPITNHSHIRGKSPSAAAFTEGGALRHWSIFSSKRFALHLYGLSFRGKNAVCRLGGTGWLCAPCVFSSSRTKRSCRRVRHAHPFPSVCALVRYPCHQTQCHSAASECSRPAGMAHKSTSARISSAGATACSVAFRDLSGISATPCCQQEAGPASLQRRTMRRLRPSWQQNRFQCHRSPINCTRGEKAKRAVIAPREQGEDACPPPKARPDGQPATPGSVRGRQGCAGLHGEPLSACLPWPVCRLGYICSKGSRSLDDTRTRPRPRYPDWPIPWPGWQHADGRGRRTRADRLPEYSGYVGGEHLHR